MKIKPEIFNCVSHKELDEVVWDFYNKEFSFVQAVGAYPMSLHRFFITGILSDNDIETIHEFLYHGDYYYKHVEPIMNDLCKSEIIRPGNYLIEVQT